MSIGRMLCQDMRRVQYEGVVGRALWYSLEVQYHPAVRANPVARQAAMARLFKRAAAPARMESRPSVVSSGMR